MPDSKSPPLPLLEPRKPDSHKGDFGHALLVGGGPGMSGAITLAALAALRTGAGRTTVAARSHTRQIVQSTTPCSMTMPLDEVSKGFLAPSAAEQLVKKHSPGMVLGVGPGLGREAGQDQMIIELFKSYPGTAVFDADALNAISESVPWWSSISSWQLHTLTQTTPPKLSANQADADFLRSLKGPRILTPHPGEWARLTNIRADQPEQQQQAALELAKHTQMVIVLKSHQTLVTDGHRQYRNTTGNPSLAVGGSGDVLTGMIVAMVCQGLSPFGAAMLAVYLHGLAADLAHAQLGTPSTLGTDLIDFIPAAFKQYRSEIR